MLREDRVDLYPFDEKLQLDGQENDLESKSTERPEAMRVKRAKKWKK